MAQPIAMSDPWRQLLEDWYELARDRREEHRRSVSWRQFWGSSLGVSNTMLSTVAGTAIFAAWQSNASLDDKAKLAITGISLSAAVLTGLLEFFGFKEKAVRHQTLADQCHVICVGIEYIFACPPSEAEIPEVLKAIRDKVAGLGVEATSRDLFGLKRLIRRLRGDTPGRAGGVATERQAT